MEGQIPPGGLGGGREAQFEQGDHIPRTQAYQQSDGIISDIRYFFFNGLQEYGWGVLLLCALLYIAYSKISSNLNTPSSARSSAASSSARGSRRSAPSEDPEKILEQQEKIAAARARMQVKIG